MASPSTTSPSTTFTEDGTIQTFLVQTSGEYEITAVGADGGDSQIDGVGTYATGGAGAEVQGDFALTAGETIEILVGGAGLNDYQPPGTLGGGAGGGGGTFVVLEGATPADNVLLEAAGGGGGAESYYGASNGVDGQAGIGGTAGLAYDPSPNLGALGYGGAGGSNGSGGDSGIGTNGGAAPSDYITGGGGGAGYSGDGGVIDDFTNASGMVAQLTPAQSFQHGGEGGTYPGDGTGGVDNGGYGGGGATDGFEGGGGGGYSGGGGGGYAGGGGGGSYVNEALATNSVVTGGENKGADEVAGGNGIATLAPIPCFCRGTRISVPGGETAVEDLRVGEAVLTAAGAFRPIVWIGQRALDPMKHPDPGEVCPIRVAAGAFGDKLPLRDLWLSPEHCLAAEGALIPASSLVNGVSVAQVRTNAVEYWHIELDAHDVILAEGLPVESYLDTGNRTAFVNGGAFVEAHPDFRPRHWAETCLPLVTRGPAVVATKARLLARIAERGLRIEHEADAHIVVDGQRVEPTHRTDRQIAFTLPAGGREITLRSKTFIPAHMVAHSMDARQLGISVRRLRVDDCEVALDREEIDEWGWREAEFAGGRFTHRWTAGNTRIPPGAKAVIVDLAGFGAYWGGSNESDFSLSA